MYVKCTQKKLHKMSQKRTYNACKMYIFCCTKSMQNVHIFSVKSARKKGTREEGIA